MNAKAGEYRRSELRGLAVTISARYIGPLQDNCPFSTTSSESQETYLTTGNLTLQALDLFSAYARLYNAAASPVSRLRSAGSLAIIFPLRFINSIL